MSWFKFYNLWRQPAPKNAGTIENYLPYGQNDDFPLQLDKSISESETATSCLSTVQDFIEGFGFSDTNLEKLVINSKGENFWQFHQQTTDSWAEFEGFYWLLRFNALAQVTEIEFLPFENCRLGIPDSNGYISHIFYNPFFGTSEYKGQNKKETKVYDVFNPNAVKAQIAKQKGSFKGQVLFHSTTSARSRYYPRPQVYSANKWMKIEAGVSDYHEDKIDNGFLDDYILVMKGNPNDPSQNPDYNNPDDPNATPVTVGQEFDDVMSRNFMGRGKHSTVMVQWVNNSDEKPEVVTIPNSANSDRFINLDNQATKKITVAFKVPSILANISEGVSLGGDGNMVRVAVKLMQQRVIKKQRVLTDHYEKVLKLFFEPYTNPVVIVPYNPYPEMEILDDKIWNALTPEEQREWINENTEIDLSEEPGTVEQPTQQTARISNAIPVKFNDKIKATVKRALDYQDKMALKCSGKAGREVSNMIIEDKPMGLKQLKRIYGYLKKNEQENNKPFNEGCNVILYNAWGGKDMFDYLDGYLNQVNAWLN